jgi:hypothetical protein
MSLERRRLGRHHRKGHDFMQDRRILELERRVQGLFVLGAWDDGGDAPHGLGRGL